jgi:hypothetical protein
VTIAQAHATCLTLLLVDFLARTWRMQWLLRGLGHRLPFWEIFVHSALGEAGSSLTPFRLGGEPSRIWAMTRFGVLITPAVIGIGVEIVAMTPGRPRGRRVGRIVSRARVVAAAGPALSRRVVDRRCMRRDGVGVVARTPRCAGDRCGAETRNRSRARARA